MDKRISKYFEQFPKHDELYETADGQVFLNKEHAYGHAKRLKDKEVTTRKCANTSVQSEATTLSKEQAEKRLNELDFTDAKPLNYEELKALAEALAIKPNDNKKQDYANSLADYKASLTSAE